jgi:hypothetical protein
MMFETFITLGIKVTGTVTKSDYDQLQPVVKKLVQAQGDIRLLLDLTGFQGENLDAFEERPDSGPGSFPQGRKNSYRW